jgi:hypothetical protein
MLEILSKNSDWLFSGLGVVVLSFLGREIWQRFGPKKILQPPSTEISVTVQPPPPTIAEKAYQPVNLDRVFITKRVKAGDYIDLVRDRDRRIRITVAFIENMEITRKYKSEAETVAAVSLNIDLGGAVAHAGINVRENGVNRFTMPQSAAQESEDSIYHFHNSVSYSSIFRVYAEHINPQAGEVDLNILHIVGLVSAT